MIISEIKKLADEGNIERLHYIFVDSLDVDPTFENYHDSYEYCKNITGFFVEHEELTPLNRSYESLDKIYWREIKKDLIKNFSEKRFEYMTEIAKHLFSEKIKRLLQERKNKSSIQCSSFEETPVSSNHKESSGVISYSISDEEIEQKRKQSEIERQAAIKREREAREHSYKTEDIHDSNKESSTNKKRRLIIVGIALATLAVAAIAIITIVLADKKYPY